MRPLIKSLLTAGVLASLAATSHATDFVELQKLSPSDLAANQWFGLSVAIDGDRLLAGRAGTASNVEKESATLFERQANGVWVESAKLSIPVGDDVFGAPVALSGDVALVGSSVVNQGMGTVLRSVLVFERQADATWKQTATLTSGVLDDLFGATISVSGTRAAVGAPWDDGTAVNSGAVHLFERQAAGTWSAVAKVKATDAAALDDFGRSVSLVGDRLLVGAPGDDDVGASSGSAYVFERQTSGVWAQVTKLNALDGAVLDDFGARVDLAADRAIVGATGDSHYAFMAGSAYVFERQASGSWLQISKLVPTDLTSGEAFGEVVTIDGDLAAVGSPWHLGPAGKTGAVFVFERTGVGTWSQVAKLIGSDVANFDDFGRSVALSGGRLVASAPTQSSGGLLSSGGAFVFESCPGLATTYGDGCPGSGGFVPALSMSECFVGGGQVSVSISNGNGGAPSLLGFGAMPAAVPIGAGCSLLVSPLLPVLLPVPLGGTGPGAGSAALVGFVPALPGLAFTMQAFVLDPGSALGFSTTNGVEVTLR